ncbi:MAG: pilus assembly protein PilM [Candidatus Saganbacteria bacterium]|nr:pilus assembly protein PilM [Candidatus Saganbacteria bacterium]
MANRKLGIHLTPNSFKLVEVDLQASGCSVLNWAVEYSPLHSPADFQETSLAAALKKNNIKARDAALVLSEADIVYKVIDLPTLPEAEVAETIRYKTTKMLPYPPKDLILDYYKLNASATSQKQFYLVAAVSEKTILDRIEIAKKAGIDVQTVVAPASALKNVLKSINVGAAALIYVGRSSTQIVLVKQGQVVFAREAKVGGDNIAQAMVGVVRTEAGTLELGANHAEELKNAFGIPINTEEYTKEAGVPGAEILGMMRPALEKISTEILTTFAYYRKEMEDDTEFKNVYFTGGTTRIKNFIPFFKYQLGLDVEALSLSPDIKSDKKDFGQVAPVLSLAIGAVLPGKEILKLKAVVPAKSTFTPNLGLQESFKQILSPSSLILLYIVLLLAVLVWFSSQSGKVESMAKRLNNEYSSLQNTYNQKMAELAQTSEKSVSMDRFVNIINTIDKITPDDIYLSNISYNRTGGELLLTGIALQKGKLTNLPLFMDRLEKSSLFKAVASSSLQESNAYTVPTYNFTVRCVCSEVTK